jgi:hypothetical protein
VEKNISCIKTEDGVFANRSEFIDLLEELFERMKHDSRIDQDENLYAFIQMLTSFGEPPGAEDGDGGYLEFASKDEDEAPPAIQWRYCDDIGVCFSVLDLMRFVLSIPISYYTTQAIMFCLINLIDPATYEEGE